MDSPTIRYDLLYDYAQKHGLDYNELCSLVRAAIRSEAKGGKP